MDILVVGADAFGCYLAAELLMSGQRVTLLAKDVRAAFLRENGVLLRHPLERQWTTLKIPVKEELLPEDMYDLVLITVKKPRLRRELPQLRANKKCPLYLFLCDNGDIRSLNRELFDASRVAYGAPCGDGYVEKGIAYFWHESRPVLVLGETLGRESLRLRDLCPLFERTGIRPRICPDIDAYLKNRLALRIPFALRVLDAASHGVLPEAGPDAFLMAEAAQECVRMLRTLRIGKESPFAVRLCGLPKTARGGYFAHLMRRYGEGYALSLRYEPAAEEVTKLLDDFSALRPNDVPMPAFDRLCTLAQVSGSPHEK